MRPLALLVAVSAAASAAAFPVPLSAADPPPAARPATAAATNPSAPPRLVLRGSVADETGAAVAGARVRWLHRAAGPVEATADADGRYELRLGPGPQVLVGPSGAGRPDVRVFDAAAGAEVVEDFVVAAEENRVIAGRVTDLSGAPVPEAAVAVRSATPDIDRLTVRTLRTDEAGRFRTEIRAGRYVLRGMSKDGSRLGLARVPDDGSEAEVRLSDPAVVTGRLIDAAGKPLAGKEVNWTPAFDGPEPFATFQFGNGFGGTVTTDADGRFTVKDVAPGAAYAFMLKLDGDRLRQLKLLDVDAVGEVPFGEFRVSD